MSDIKKWGSDDESKFTDTSMGKITYDRAVFDGVVADVSMFKAAPDLYKALDDLVTAWHSRDDEFRMNAFDTALEVLKKARGECHE